MARRLEGMTRHASVHAAGVVIAPTADHRVRAALQGQQTGRNHDAVGHEGDRARRPPEDGLPRAEHADAASTTRVDADQADRRASTLDIDHLPLDDAKTYQAVPGRPDLRRVPVRELGHARHPAQGQAAAPRRPDRAQRALPARPAPGRHGRRLHRRASTGRTEVKYELPQLEPILADTYGVIAYQEQVMRIASDAGRLHAGPGRRAAQGHGQEGAAKSWRRSATRSWTGAASKGINGEEGRRRSST